MHVADAAQLTCLRCGQQVEGEGPQPHFSTMRAQLQHSCLSIPWAAGNLLSKPLHDCWDKLYLLAP